MSVSTPTVAHRRRLRVLNGHPLLRYTLRRIAAGVVLFVVSILIFAATEVLPRRGDRDPRERPRRLSLAALREKLDLDQPAVQRYLSWIGGVLQGDLGESLSAQRPITEVIGPRVRNSLVLAVLTTLLLIPLSIGLGILAGARRGFGEQITRFRASRSPSSRCPSSSWEPY